LKGSPLIQDSSVQTIKESEVQIKKRKQEIEVKKQEFEKLIAVWKGAMNKSERIVKYIDHWYDDVNQYSYVVMEYCAGGDLGEKIKKKINENGRFTKQVYEYN
jgi:serine/threonine protein kinase